MHSVYSETQLGGITSVFVCIYGRHSVDLKVFVFVDRIATLLRVRLLISNVFLFFGVFTVLLLLTPRLRYPTL